MTRREGATGAASARPLAFPALDRLHRKLQIAETPEQQRLALTELSRALAETREALAR